MEEKHFHTITVGPRVNYEFALRRQMKLPIICINGHSGLVSKA